MCLSAARRGTYLVFLSVPTSLIFQLRIDLTWERGRPRQRIINNAGDRDKACLVYICRGAIKRVKIKIIEQCRIGMKYPG